MLCLLGDSSPISCRDIKSIMPPPSHVGSELLNWSLELGTMAFSSSLSYEDSRKSESACTADRVYVSFKLQDHELE